jgi:hypothetical protein
MSGEMRFVPVSALEAGTLTWLDQDYVPAATFGLLEGDPSMGKSLLTQHLAARLSQAGQAALLLLGEGRRTVRARLERLGADCDRVQVLDEPARHRLDTQGLGELRRRLIETRPALCAFDPLQSFAPLTGGTALRGLCDQLTALGEEFTCTMLAIRHFAKRGGTNPAHAGYGGIELYAHARFVLQVGPNPHAPDERLLLVAKMSDGPAGQARAYRITDQGTVAWRGARTVSAEEMRRGAAHVSAEDAVRAYILQALANGPRPSKVVKDEGREQWGLSEGTFNRVRAKMDKEGVIATKHFAVPGQRWGGGIWVMKLPAHDWPDAATAVRAVRPLQVVGESSGTQG